MTPETCRQKGVYKTVSAKLCSQSTLFRRHCVVDTVSSTLLLLLTFGGCGYSTQSLLPANYRRVYVEPFINKLVITGETTELQRFATSLPRLEEDVTSGVIKRFIFDGHLRVTPNRNEADLVLSGELTSFYRQALRVDEARNIEEYRLNLVASVALRESKTGTLVWEEPGMIGDATYFLTGGSATTEFAAVQALVTDFSRRVVERTIENW